MRVLYGVNGEGMGHATRSEVVIGALMQRHEVRVVTSGAALRHLSGRLPRVEEVFGYTFAMGEGQIRRWQTVLLNLRLARHELPDTLRHWVSLIDDWKPEVVISDFEPLSGMYARWTRTPLLAVDNINMIDRCRHDREIIGSEREDYLIARAVARSMVPHAFEYFVTTFFRPPPLRKRTTLVPPIVRPEIARAVSAVRRPPGGVLERREAAAGRTARERRQVHGLRDARWSGRAHDRRQPRVPPAVERGLRGGAANLARGDRRRRLLAAQRGGLPGQAGAVRAAARPVRAAHERPLPGPARIRRLRPAGHRAPRSPSSSTACPSSRMRWPPTSRWATRWPYARSSTGPRRWPRPRRGSAAGCAARPGERCSEGSRPDSAGQGAGGGCAGSRRGRVRLLPRAGAHLSALRRHHLPRARRRSR